MSLFNPLRMIDGGNFLAPCLFILLNMPIPFLKLYIIRSSAFANSGRFFVLWSNFTISGLNSKSSTSFCLYSLTRFLITFLSRLFWFFLYCLSLLYRSVSISVWNMRSLFWILFIGGVVCLIGDPMSVLSPVWQSEDLLDSSIFL